MTEFIPAKRKKQRNFRTVEHSAAKRLQSGKESLRPSHAILRKMTYFNANLLITGFRWGTFPFRFVCRSFFTIQCGFSGGSVFLQYRQNWIATASWILANEWYQEWYDLRYTCKIVHGNIESTLISLNDFSFMIMMCCTKPLTAPR